MMALHSLLTVVTVNDYLAQRDAEWMGRVHRFLGLSVGLIQVYKFIGKWDMLELFSHNNQLGIISAGGSFHNTFLFVQPL